MPTSFQYYVTAKFCIFLYYCCVCKWERGQDVFNKIVSSPKTDECVCVCMCVCVCVCKYHVLIILMEVCLSTFVHILKSSSQ